MTLRGVASSISAKVGGDDMDDAIIRYMRNKYNHVIGILTAEQVKKTIGCALPGGVGNTMDVPGRDAVTGLPSVCRVTSEDIHEAIAEPLGEIVGVIQQVLENTPPELAGDVMTGGIVLTGGLSQMSGIADLIAKRTGVACRVAENPEDCVAKGLGKAMKYADVMRSGVYDISQFSYRLADPA